MGRHPTPEAAIELYDRIKLTLGRAFDQAEGWEYRPTPDGRHAWRASTGDGARMTLFVDDEGQLTCATVRDERVACSILEPGSDGYARATPIVGPTPSE